MGIDQLHGSPVYLLCEDPDYCTLLKKVFTQIGFKHYVEFDEKEAKFDFNKSRVILAFTTTSKLLTWLHYLKKNCPNKMIIFLGYSTWKNIERIRELIKILNKCNPVIITHTAKDYNTVKNLVDRNVKVLNIPIHLLTTSGMRDPLPQDGYMIAYFNNCVHLANTLDLLSKIGIHMPTISIGTFNCNHPLIINIDSDELYLLIPRSMLGLLSIDDIKGFEIEGILSWDSRPSIVCGELAIDLEHDESPLISKINGCDPEVISEKVLKIINSLMFYRKLGVDIATIWNFRDMLKNALSELIE